MSSIQQQQQKTFIISDHHFGHNKIYSFTDNGTRIRPWASSSKEGDQYMIEKWNSVVCKRDIVFHLGDVSWERYLSNIAKCNGKKILIKGNHDRACISAYKEYFHEIHGMKYFPKCNMIFSHAPLHPGTFGDRWKVNVHGHLHTRAVRLDLNDHESELDYRYFNACVEDTPHRKDLGLAPGIPFELDQVVEWLKTKGIEFDNNI